MYIIYPAGKVNILVQDVRIADELVKLGYAVWNTTLVSSSSASGTTVDATNECIHPVLVEQVRAM